MITILKCGPEHISLLFDIAVKSYTEAYEYLWTDNGVAYMQKFYSKQLWEEEIKTGVAGYFLIHNNQEAVGYFKIKENSLEPYHQKDCLEIEKLYLLGSSTGMGIGKNVLCFIGDLAKVQNKRLIWLNVMQSSPATSFYELNGFKPVRESYLEHPYMKDEFRALVTFIKHLNDPIVD